MSETSEFENELLDKLVNEMRVCVRYSHVVVFYVTVLNFTLAAHLFFPIIRIHLIGSILLLSSLLIFIT